MSTPTPRAPDSPDAAETAEALPDIEIRFSARYAWMLIAFGGIFFVLGFLVGAGPYPNVTLGLLISAAGMGAVIGGLFWRNHLHIVARITSFSLILHRGGVVRWTEIALIEKKSITMSKKGVKHTSEYVCIRLKTPRPTGAGLQGFMNKLKVTVLGGYDIVVPDSELSCTADWFIGECWKRMGTARQ